MSLSLVKRRLNRRKKSSYLGFELTSPARQVDAYHLQHGDMLYMVPLAEDLFPSTSRAAEAMETQSEPESKASSTVGGGELIPEVGK